MNNCQQCPAGSLNQEDIDALSLDSGRFRWLSENHTDPETRGWRDAILTCMKSMPYSDVCRAIGTAIGEEEDRKAIQASAAKEAR
jgi:hypothetical protein